ncbi:FecR family protein [Roseospira navarrensis]|uniref:FecR protein domain-containing protein n=1 Tax=Roseospira navarrensis TaxID=140058 RepID=A0A7X2D4A6_9PROT|nr:FecR family protein [Roseospira navarrensis]MQX35995.1 hypothetical protein [Roseospira navarrensis]
MFRVIAARPTGLLAVLSLALALVAGAPGSAGAQEDAAAGRVEATSGAVAVIRGGVSARLAPDDPVLVGDQVVTGEAGKVVIALQGGGTLTAGPGSRVTVADYARGAEDRGVFDMLAGIFRASLEPGDPWDRFEVQSRTAVASARNTEFIVEASALNTAVVTLSGRVGVTARAPAAAGATVELGPGEGTDVARGALPTPPATWGAPRVRAFDDRTTLP